MRHERVTNRDFARALRGHSTEAEVAMWDIVRGRRLFGLKFRRQEPIGSYIVDFYCDELKLGIELDGEGHMTPEGFAADAVRTHALQALGLTIVRIENHEVLLNSRFVIDRIGRLVEALRTPRVTATPIARA